MLRKTMAAVFALALALTAGTSSAQCVLGVYSDAAGTSNVQAGHRNGDTFNFYVILFTEDLADAVGYSIDIPGNGIDIFITGESYGPTGNGINISNQDGENVGLGDCYPGFNGTALIVTTYSAIQPFYAPDKVITLGPNPGSGGSTTAPVYSNCQGDLLPCGNNPSLLIEGPVATESTSFGQVKALYSN